MEELKTQKEHDESKIEELERRRETAMKEIKQLYSKLAKKEAANSTPKVRTEASEDNI
jgi:hypothetical protein